MTTNIGRSLFGADEVYEEPVFQVSYASHLYPVHEETFRIEFTFRTGGRWTSLERVDVCFALVDEGVHLRVDISSL